MRKLVCCLLLLWAAACGGRPDAPEDLLPGADSGWTPAGERQVFDRDTLFDLMDGQAEGYLVYSFERSAVQTYQNTAGAELRVTISRFGTAADAYGLYTTAVRGEPVTVGTDGDGNPGERLTFWRDRYMVDVYARPPIAGQDLENVGKAIADRLPPDAARPALLDKLPADGLAARSPVFFHQEMSIQDRLWLGGENRLGLGTTTDGLLAGYQRGGEGQLLLIRYPAAEAASAGLAALQGGGVEGLVAARAQDRLVGAVFGEIEANEAQKLLEEALR